MSNRECVKDWVERRSFILSHPTRLIKNKFLLLVRHCLFLPRPRFYQCSFRGEVTNDRHSRTLLPNWKVTEKTLCLLNMNGVFDIIVNLSD